MESSVGFASDLRLCTRTSMPSQLLQECAATRATPGAKQEVQRLLKSAMIASQQREEEKYRVYVEQLAQFVLTHVRPNKPEDVRLLFDLDEPSEPFASRAKLTALEHYAWLDVAAVRSACQKTIDVACDSREPSATTPTAPTELRKTSAIGTSLNSCGSRQ